MTEPPASYPSTPAQGRVPPFPDPRGAPSADTPEGRRRQRHLAELLHINSLKTFRSKFVQHAKLSLPISLQVPQLPATAYS
jgi:hypothetical protein